MRSQADSYASDAVPPWLALITGAMVVAMLYLTFVWVPMEASMGVVQRIFYFHVPSAFVAFTAFTIGGVASIRFLARRESRFDDLSVAANEVGLLFAIVNLVTGSLWAKPIWGVWWAWDARLTTMLLLALIYVAYLILRQSVVEPTQRAVVCAVVSIFGMVDIPIVYMANQWWRTQHPAPVLSGEGSLDPRMRFVLYFSFAALLFVFWCLVRMRRRIEHIRREMDALRREVHAL
ncbi:MAG: cytochrome c biogenesis protein CcsA [Bryobacterales bacterium]|nr:cytochrome c biogenesis protein CcsA [Bryobacterales bacterium]